MRVHLCEEENCVCPLVATVREKMLMNLPVILSGTGVLCEEKYFDIAAQCYLQNAFEFPEGDTCVRSVSQLKGPEYLEDSYFQSIILYALSTLSDTFDTPTRARFEAESRRRFDQWVGRSTC